MLKPLDGGGGKGISLVKTGEMNADTLLKNLTSEYAVIEERIVQSEQMAAFHPESLNTIRVTCFACKDGLHIVWPQMRIGRGSSVIDNPNQGGILVPLDVKTGQMMSKGYDGSGGVYSSHPDSGLVFSDYTVPDWNEMIELTKKLMAIVPECKYVGWDLAHTNNGWIVVEGNHDGQQSWWQIFTGAGIKAEFDKYLELL